VVAHAQGATTENRWMHTPTEKKEFAQRLQMAAANASPAVTTATELSRHFSLRYKNGSVTPAAVRKWWDGIAFPSDDKLDVLANWLKVPKHWLRYGEAPKSKKGDSATETATPEEIILLQRWRMLPARRRKILLSLLADLGKDH
jgi:transcriptional regulator with XRE-family HTH domain